MLDKIKDFIAQPIPQQILYFEEMLTPKLIQIAYWLALVAVVWTGLERIFSGGVAGLLEGVVHIVGLAIAARVVAEIIMLFFQMQNDMELLRKNSEGGATKKKVTKKASKK
ncbi:MAG: DUF4282 domain-containing protein [Gammaproteobacteria bacterium]|nr:DUF4282 domain-containing protein [Gammaproteobacteria bacterium]